MTTMAKNFDSSTQQSAENNMYSYLLRQRRFLPLFITQFLEAFNDNFFKNTLIILFAFQNASAFGFPPEQMVTVAAGIFILPLFLFSALAGQFADKYDKATLSRVIKIAELFIMLLACIGLLSMNVVLLLLCLFLMGLHSTFFGPVKYAILPQHLKQNELVPGNALVSAATFIAILLGTLLGGLLVSLGEGGIKMICAVMLTLSVIGFITSLWIPTAPSPEPKLKIHWNPIWLTYRIIQLTKQDPTVFNATLGISWFWFVGAALLSLLPLYVKEVVGGQESLATFFLALFTIGIALGAMLCGKISKRQLELGLIGLGAFGISIFSIFIGCLKPPFGVDGILSFDRKCIILVLGFILLSISAGLYSVPLNTLIQQRSNETNRSRIIAGGNIMNALFMVLASLFLLCVQNLYCSIPQILILLGIMNLVVAIYVFRLVPEFLYRFITWILSRFTYNIHVEGLENIPLQGPAVLVCNHISWVDWLIIYGSIQRPVRFIMDYRIAKLPLIRWIVKDVQIIPIAGRHQNETVLETAFSKIQNELKKGEIICIFPEGKISSKETMNAFRPGIERIIKDTPVPVIPMALSGLWGGMFSRCPVNTNIFKRILQSKRAIELIIGSPIQPEQVSLPMLEQKVAALKRAETLYADKPLLQSLIQIYFDMLNRCLTRLFFDRIEVLGLDKIPRRIPFMILANHSNAFMDAFLIKAVLKRPVIFTVRAGLRKNVLFRLWTWLMGAVPMYGSVEQASNELVINRHSFNQLQQRLEQGSGLVIFPEGKSHSNPDILPFKTGFAQIAFSYKERHHHTFPILPVAIHYETKEKFRSSVLVEIGDPIVWAQDRQALVENAEQSLHALLRPVKTETERLWLNFVNELLLTEAREPAAIYHGKHGKGSVTQQQLTLKELRQAYIQIQGKAGSSSLQPNKVDSLFERLRQFRQKLRLLGVKPSDLFIDLKVSKALLFIIRELQVLCLGLPFLIMGSMVWGLPALLIHSLTKRFSFERDQWMTNAYAPAFFLLPVWAVLIFALITMWSDSMLAFILTTMAVYSGMISLLFLDRMQRAQHRLVSFIKWLCVPKLKLELTRYATDLIQELNNLKDTLPKDSNHIVMETAVMQSETVVFEPIEDPG